MYRAPIYPRSPSLLPSLPLIPLDVINMIPPPVDGQPNDLGVMPSYLKIRTRISQVGAWAIHCHLEYHMALGLIIPVLVGVDQSWPMYPIDLPMGPYMDF